MNPHIHDLHPYPFEKLAKLLEDIEPAADKALIKLTIGEPQHDAPEFVLDELTKQLNLVAKYPSTKGELALRQSIARWACKRFNLPVLDAEHEILPVNGTREALFAITQTLVSPIDNDLVLSPNPFYQIYEGAALLAGAELVLLPCNSSNQYRPDYRSISDDIWQRCRILFVCSPNNPCGTVTTLDEYAFLLSKAKQFHFTLVSDECYSEIYFDDASKPLGLLEACIKLNNPEYKHCLVFHSLSKRSNLPGLRSGFVAGDAEILKSFLKYRTYQGCAMPPHHQAASISAWSDEEHVQQNRERYRSKFDQVLRILQPVLPVTMPEAGFYLWPELPMDDELFCKELYRQESVLVLPGQYLGRSVEGHNPGKNHVRLALVAEEADCVEAATRIRNFLERNQGDAP